MKITLQTKNATMHKTRSIKSKEDFDALHLEIQDFKNSFEVEVYDDDFVSNSHNDRNLYEIYAPSILHQKASKVTYIDSIGEVFILKDKFMEMSEEEKEKHLLMSNNKWVKETQLNPSPKISIKELKTVEDFEALAEGDWLAVKFNKPVTWDGKEDYTFKVFPIFKVKLDDKEIVLQKKSNVYFLWENFLRGESHVESVSLITFSLV